MTGLLSSISGKFSKSLILGTFFPVVVFVTLFYWLVLPLLPPGTGWFAPIQGLETNWELLVITLATVVLSGLLYNLNTPIIRIYEGYPWRHWSIGRAKTERHKADFLAAKARSEGMRELLSELPLHAPLPDLEDRREIQTQRIKQTRRIYNQYPYKPNWLLPTRLGNTIRSFEVYSLRQYGIEAITIWPRLVAKMDSAYAASLDDAKASFDFMINSSALSFLLAGLLLISRLLYPDDLAAWPVLLGWLLTITLFLGLSYLFYLWSIDAAANWGELVKSAFDLHRWQLLGQMGYAQKPKTKEEERRLWRNIYYEMAFGDSSKGARVEYGDTKTAIAYPSIQSSPPGLKLSLVRSRHVTQPDGEIPITIQIRNEDGYQRDAARVVVIDKLPEGFDLVWQSTSTNGDLVTVTGTNPYTFTLGQLRHQDTLELTYHMLPHPKQP